MVALPVQPNPDPVAKAWDILKSDKIDEKFLDALIDGVEKDLGTLKDIRQDKHIKKIVDSKQAIIDDIRNIVEDESCQ